jgi:ABC-type Fe3+-siderophore transport system permease subunit
MLQKPQTYLLLALGAAMAYFIWTNPVLFEFYSRSGNQIVAVTNSWTYEIFEENQILRPYPNYWLIGGFYGVVMVWVIALMTYNRPRAQLFGVLALAGILVTYGMEILITYWVYQTNYYPTQTFAGKVYWEVGSLYAMAGYTLYVAWLIHKKRRLPL